MLSFVIVCAKVSFSNQKSSFCKNLSTESSMSRSSMSEDEGTLQSCCEVLEISDSERSLPICIVGAGYVDWTRLYALSVSSLEKILISLLVRSRCSAWVNLLNSLFITGMTVLNLSGESFLTVVSKVDDFLGTSGIEPVGFKCNLLLASACLFSLKDEKPFAFLHLIFSNSFLASLEKCCFASSGFVIRAHDAKKSFTISIIMFPLKAGLGQLHFSLNVLSSASGY